MLSLSKPTSAFVDLLFGDRHDLALKGKRYDEDESEYTAQYD